MMMLLKLIFVEIFLILVVNFLLGLYAVVNSLPTIQNYDIWSDKGAGFSDEVLSENVENVLRNVSGNFSELDKRKSKVLNFFPIPVDDECLSNDQRRPGVCLNPYECRIQNGAPHGQCALGFGVCCIFTAQCDMDVYNNITYIISPSFPALSRGPIECNHKIKKIDPEISQIRFDFIHFSVGQPNRHTGECDAEILTIHGGRNRPVRMCGLNSGQHVYFDVENHNDPLEVTINFTKTNVERLWEIKVTQIPFDQRAPAGCLQYNTGRTGIIRTMNFADNGRHLSDQEYTICNRQEEGMCSIAYEPCDENSFRIGQTPPEVEDDDIGSGGGPLLREEPRTCSDRILLPCDSEEFIMPGFVAPGTCDMAHCGSSFCPPGTTNCRVESTTTPFNIGIQFGPAARMESPEDNLGMCLKYEQQPCAV